MFQVLIKSGFVIDSIIKDGKTVVRLESIGDKSQF